MASSSAVNSVSGRDPAAPPLALLRSLEWRVKQAVETALSGEYRSSFRGRGMEFDQVVKYEFGDDVRDIDWNVTARLGEPYRKKFVEEREVCFLIVFEDSLSLQFGSGERTKRDCLLELASLFMLLGAVNRDRVGLVYASPTGHSFRRPVPGREAILHSAATLLGQPLPDLQSSSSVEMPWKLISKAAPRHTILLWLGDFSAEREPEGWSMLKKQYQPMGFRIDDPWERELPHGGKLPIFDPVSGDLTILDTNSSNQRAAHAEWVQRRNTTFHSLFADRTTRLAITTEEPPIDAMVRFLHRRMAGR
jgi:hypothetical protein